MRICTFLKDGAARLGGVDGDTIVDLAQASGDAPEFANTHALIQGGAAALAKAANVMSDAQDPARHALTSVQLAAPVMPSTVLCSGSNYHAHNAEKANTPISGKEPEFFLKTADCVVSPDEAVVCDIALTEKLDAETELAIVIGKPGRHIPVADALSHVFGYTVSNDITARDRQVRRSPEGFTWYELGRGKAFDTSLPLGPVIVTADEIPDPQDADPAHPDQRRVAPAVQHRRHDLDLRRADPPFLDQLHPETGHGDPDRNPRRNLLVRRHRRWAAISPPRRG